MLYLHFVTELFNSEKNLMSEAIWSWCVCVVCMERFTVIKWFTSCLRRAASGWSFPPPLAAAAAFVFLWSLWSGGTGDNGSDANSAESTQFQPPVDDKTESCRFTNYLISNESRKTHVASSPLQRRFFLFLLFSFFKSIRPLKFVFFFARIYKIASSFWAVCFVLKCWVSPRF